MILSASTISVLQNQQKEITLPYFGKKGNDYYCVLNDSDGKEKIVRVTLSNSYKTISNQPLSFCESDIIQAEEITEDEFVCAYEIAAHESESLLCTLKIAS